MRDQAIFGRAGLRHRRGILALALAALAFPASAADPARFVGTYRTKPFLDEVLASRPLATALTPAGVRNLRENLQVTGPIERVGDSIVLSGQAPHAGGDEEAIVALGAGGGPAAVGLLSGNRVTVFAAAPPAPNSPVGTWVRERGANRPVEHRTVAPAR